MSARDHIQGLEDKIQGQAERIRQLEVVEDFRKRQLDALHYVWCTGGCEKGIHRFGEHPPLTRELLIDAYRCVARMTEKVLALEFKDVAEHMNRRPTYEQIRDVFDRDPKRSTLREMANALYAAAKKLGDT